MAGPSPAFLAQLHAGLAQQPPAPDPFAAGAAAAGFAPVAAPNADATLMGGGASTGSAPIVVPGVQPAPSLPPAGPPAPPPAGQVQPVSMPAQAAPESPTLQANPDDVKFSAVTSPGRPAQEIDTRGPRQNALLDRSYIHPLEAADRIETRSTEQSAREQTMYDEQANTALERQAAFERQAARRQHELMQLQSDYQNTITQLANHKVDNNRVWNNTSTLDKIGATLLVMLGTVGTGGDPGKNLVYQSLLGQINDDVDNQKRAYDHGLDVLKGQQTAYAMAMERYGSEDAADHAARAAAQEAVAAKINGMKASWKGTDAQNYADQIRGQLLSSADQMRADGLRYLQPTGGSTKYRMEIRGQQVPGLVSEEKAQGYAVEHGVKPAERVDETLIKGGLETNLEAQKQRGAQTKEAKKFQVRLPNGETVDAPSEQEAKELRDLSVQTSKTQRLVNDARKIREDATFRASSSGRGRLKQIQAELVTGFGVQHKLGALSDADYDIALAGTADLFQFGNGVEARLERLSSEALKARMDRVATYPGAPPKSSGTMPGSFEAK